MTPVSLLSMPSVLKYKKRYDRRFHDGPITSIAMNSRGSVFAVGSVDGTASVWALDTGLALHCINARTPIRSLVWSTGSEGFIFGCENGILVSVFLEEAYIKTVYFHAHSGPVHCISPYVNDSLLISGAVNEITVWKRDRHHAAQEETWEVFKTVPPPLEQDSLTGQPIKVTSVNWLPRRDSSEQRHRFLVSSYLWHGVMCWDITSLTILWRLATPDCLSLALLPNGSLVAAYGVSSSFEIHDVETQRLVQALPWEARSDLVSPPVAFAHDGFAVINGGRGKACVWDAERGDELQVLDHGGTCSVTALVAHASESADRFLIITGTDERKSGRIVLWDTIPYAYVGETNAEMQDVVTRDPLPNTLAWVMIGVAALLGWRWIV